MKGDEPHLVKAVARWEGKDNFESRASHHLQCLTNELHGEILPDANYGKADKRLQHVLPMSVHRIGIIPTAFEAKPVGAWSGGVELGYLDL